MRRISLNSAQPGMALAADAVNAQQMLLLKKGAKLTEKTLHTLKSWGVEAVWVAQPETPAEPPVSTADDRPGLEEEILSRFGDTLENPVMDAICRSAIRIVAERGITDE